MSLPKIGGDDEEDDDDMWRVDKETEGGDRFHGLVDVASDDARRDGVEKNDGIMKVRWISMHSE